MEAEYGPVSDDSTCPIELKADCKIDIKTQLETACNYKGECNILKQHYDTF